MREVSRRHVARKTFKGCAAITSRYVSIPRDALEFATRSPGATFDALNQWNNDAWNDGAEIAIDFGESCATNDDAASLDL